MHGDELHRVGAADEDVRAAVGEALEDLGDEGRAGHAAEALAVVQGDREGLVALLAPGRELAVARLEDVERLELAGQEDEAEREKRNVGDHRSRTG